MVVQVQNRHSHFHLGMERGHQATLSPAGQIPLGFKEDSLWLDALSFGPMVVALLAPGPKPVSLGSTSMSTLCVFGTVHPFS